MSERRAGCLPAASLCLHRGVVQSCQTRIDRHSAAPDERHSWLMLCETEREGKGRERKCHRPESGDGGQMTSSQQDVGRFRRGTFIIDMGRWRAKVDTAVNSSTIRRLTY